MTRYECCATCLYYGAVNKDDTMRRHKPAINASDAGQRRYDGRTMIQDRNADDCPGSNGPFMRFGNE